MEGWNFRAEKLDVKPMLQIDGINIATELITRYYYSSNAVLMLGQRLRRWPNIEPTLNKCTMFERKSSVHINTSLGQAVSTSPQ